MFTPMLALALVPALALAFTLAPAPARAQAARVDTPTTIGGRRITTSSTIPRVDADADTNANAPKTNSKISPRASAAILSGFKYQPPPPPKPQNDDEVDLRDIDKPRNTIIRLPNYVVTARKPPIFTDRTLHTQDQLKKLAVARYLGDLDKYFLNRWTIPLLGETNENRAMQLYLENERQQNMSGMQQQISTQQTLGNTDTARQMRSQYYDMFLHPLGASDKAPDSSNRQQGQ